jgi:hypothetical protein
MPAKKKTTEQEELDQLQKEMDLIDELIKELESKEPKTKKAAKAVVTKKVWPKVKEVKDQDVDENLIFAMYESIKDFFTKPMEKKKSEKKVVEKKYPHLAKATKETLPKVVTGKLTKNQRTELNKILKGLGDEI